MMKLRKYIIVLLCCFIQGVYANTMLNVTYTSYNYKMTSLQFNKFLKEYKFDNQSYTTKNNNYVVYKNTIQPTALDTINKNLVKQFTEINNGSSRCEINKTSCQFLNTSTLSNGVETSSFLEIKLLSSNMKNLDNAKISGLYKKPYDKFLLSFTTSLDDISNHNYIIISQLLKNNFLYGQIILVSFSVYQ